jgi:photosystem II stability/assembly factor-like uncharacterized protein
MKTIFSLLMLIAAYISYGQSIKILNLDHPTVSFRGLSVVDDYVLWVSGSKGTIGFSMNGGKSFYWVNPKGYENRDFRDIEAFDHQTAIAIAVGEPGLILKTTDSGNNWKVVYKDEEAGVFLDDVEFSKTHPTNGIVIGDPVNGEPYVLSTSDQGTTWQKLPTTSLQDLSEGEAFFAASGSNSYLMDEKNYLSVTGGSTSHLMINTQPAAKISLSKSKTATSGANGMDYWAATKFGMIVGGDYENPQSSENNLFIFELNQFNKPVIHSPQTPPTGYKSGVAIINATTAISCGLGGVDISKDKGLNWKNMTTTQYHACKRSKKGTEVYFTGPNGRIGKLFPY